MSHVWAKLTVWFDRVIGRRFYVAHRAVYQASGGWVGHRSGAGPMLLLTTVGRKSGLLRTHPLLYMPDGANYVVVGSNGGRPEPPAWVLNLTSTPKVKVQVGRTVFYAHARLLRGDDAAAMWPRLTEHYSGWSYYQELTERELIVVSLEPRWPASAQP